MSSVGGMPTLGYVVGVLAWETCQSGCCEWCVSMDKVVHILAWVGWMA